MTDLTGDDYNLLNSSLKFQVADIKYIKYEIQTSGTILYSVMIVLFFTQL